MTHIYDPTHAHHLDSLFRRLMYPPVKILKHIGLQPDDIFCDIGAGTGFFSIPASGLLPKGKVIAVDIQPIMIQLLSQKITDLHITNIETIVSTNHDLLLSQESITFAFMSFVLHEVENKEQMLCTIYNALRSDGKIAIIEFSKKALFGPPKHERISENEIKNLLENAGFNDISLEKYNFFAYLAKARKL